ncbi:ABC transporter ATPase [Vibrio cholerae]|uniref:ABC transporter ATPase n=1 Tax=Vibrio cholerae TaxID=666 RepID=UPI0030805066|nr:ABC transporter ATPase [Vibrio cholerae]
MNINKLSSESLNCNVQVIQSDSNNIGIDVKSVSQGSDVLSAVLSRKTSFLSKIKSSRNGYKEKSPELVKEKATQQRQQRSRLSSIEIACEKSFDSLSDEIKLSGMKQHYLSFGASIMDREFSLICSQSEEGKQLVENYKDSIRLEFIQWLSFDTSKKDPKEIWASSANKSLIENGLRNAVDSLKSPGLDRATKEERRKAQQFDYQSLTEVSNQLLDRFNQLSEAPLKSSDNNVISSRQVERKVFQLVDKYFGN